VSREFEDEGEYILRTFLMQALVQQSINDEAGILNRCSSGFSMTERATRECNCSLEVDHVDNGVGWGRLYR
jgi:hypothetical protein